MVFGLLFKAPVFVAFGIPFTVIPIATYRVVFRSLWSEAALIWIVVSVVQASLGYALILAGLVSLSAFTGA